jgi:Xaa-Pro aminopeptidase
MIARLRRRKSPEEIEALLSAAAQADSVMQAAVDACAPGVTEAEAAWAAEEAFRRSGADRVEFTLVAAGAHAAFPHHHSGTKKMQSGEGIIIDIGASLNSYKSDITRMVFLGEPAPEFMKVYDTVLKANEEGRRAVKPGVTAGEIDRAARSVIEEAGYGGYFIHRTGHGLGLDIHEEPSSQESSTAVLEEGMVFSVEPGIYLPEKLGVRIEDIVTVTAEGAKTFTGFTRALTVK